MFNETLHPSLRRSIVSFISPSQYFRERSRQEPTLAAAILFETIKIHVSIGGSGTGERETTNQARTKVVCIFYHSSIRSGVSRSALHGARGAAKSLGTDGEKARRRQRTERAEREKEREREREERVAPLGGARFVISFALFFPQAFNPIPARRPSSRGGLVAKVLSGLCGL